MVSLEVIQSFCSGKIAISESLAPVTSFRIGGPADFYLEPSHRDEVIALSKYFHSQNFPFIIIGNGSNILVSDDGFRGAVINLEKGFSHIEIKEDRVVAGAGIRMTKFVDNCITHELHGVEMLAGIPGTLGGAIIMNAGAYGSEISDHVTDVTVVRGDQIITISKANAGFQYRSSLLQNDIVLEATFTLEKGNKEALVKLRRELLEQRNASQPTTLPNAGSIFKNPPGYYAAKLIEEVGLKGYTVGGAKVSETHTNFIVNTGEATANNVISIIRHTRAAVKEKFGIPLKLEVRLIGFQENIFSENEVEFTP